MMNGSWGPADCATLHDATAGLPWPGYDGVSPELEAKVAAHNERAAKVKAQLKSSLTGFAEAMAKVESGCEPAKYGELFAAVESCKLDRTTLMQELAALWNGRVSLADDHAAEFKAQIPGVEKTFAETVAKVKAELETIGCGLSAMPAFGSDPTTAERQLTARATNENVHSRKARAAVVNVRSLVDAAVEQRRASVKGQETCTKFIKTVARQMLAGVA